MRIRVEVVVDVDPGAWDGAWDVDVFVRRLLTPYMDIVKSEARSEYYEGEFKENL